MEDAISVKDLEEEGERAEREWVVRREAAVDDDASPEAARIASRV